MIERDISILISIFCDVDDFCKEFELEWRKILIENQDKNLIGNKKRRNRNLMSIHMLFQFDDCKEYFSVFNRI